jgi:hypothetical protein
MEDVGLAAFVAIERVDVAGAVHDRVPTISARVSASVTAVSVVVAAGNAGRTCSTASPTNPEVFAGRVRAPHAACNCAHEQRADRRLLMSRSASQRTPSTLPFASSG